MREWNALLDFSDSTNETTDNLAKITTHLHGDDAKMIFLIAPDQESLGIIVVDTTARWPVSAGISGLEETITFLEEEVVINKLLLDFLGHASEWVESTLQLAFKTTKGRGDLGLHLLVLGLSEAWVEWVTLHGATTTDAGRDNELAIWVNINEGIAITEVTGWVLVSLLETNMVVLNDWVEQWRKERVSLSIRGVDTNTRVKVLNT